MEFGLPLCGHVFFKAEIPNKEGERETVIRKYTPISQVHEKGQIDFLIKAYHPTEQFPEGGRMSVYLDSLEVGDSMHMDGPKGKLTYKGRGNFYKEDKYMVKKKIGLVAGGTGITPIYQLIQAVAKNQDKGIQLHLMFGNRSENDILLRQELKELEELYPDLAVTFIVDKPEVASKWHGKTGYITRQILDNYMPAPSEETLICYCGPPPMNSSVLESLQAMGYTEDMIHKF